MVKTKEREATGYKEFTQYNGIHAEFSQHLGEKEIQKKIQT